VLGVGNGKAAETAKGEEKAEEPATPEAVAAETPPAEPAGEAS
jgi:hypothetical protein